MSHLATSARVFSGTPTQWNGFDRYDFECADRPAIVVVPKRPAPDRRWLWRGEFFGAFPSVDLELLNRGWHVAHLACPDTFGSPTTLDRWETFYALLTESHALNRRPVLLGMSRGGLYVYRWAARHPETVGLIYGDAPVCDIKSWPGGRGAGPGSPVDWQRFLCEFGLSDAEAMTWAGNPIDPDVLAPIAAAGIAIVHVVGDADEIVPVRENSDVLEQRYRALGGHIDVIHKPGVGHHPHSLEDPTPIVERVLRLRRS